MAVPDVGCIEGEVVPTLRAVEVAAVDLDCGGAVEGHDVGVGTEDGLVGGLQVDGDIGLVGHRRGIDVVVGNGGDRGHTSQLSAVDDGLAEGVFVEVVDRGVVGGTVDGIEADDNGVVAHAGGDVQRQAPSTGVANAADGTHGDGVAGHVGEASEGEGMGVGDGRGHGAARTKRRPYRSSRW